MKKVSRLLFLMLVLIACFQLTGAEEAFCHDSATEVSCEDCVTCAGHQFTGISDSISLPVITSSGHTFLNYLFQSPEILSLSIFRPPICH